VSANDNQVIKDLYDASVPAVGEAKNAYWKIRDGFMMPHLPTWVEDARRVSKLHTWVEKTEGFEMSRELYKKFKVWVDNGCKSGTVEALNAELEARRACQLQLAEEIRQREHLEVEVSKLQQEREENHEQLAVLMEERDNAQGEVSILREENAQLLHLHRDLQGRVGELVQGQADSEAKIENLKRELAVLKEGLSTGDSQLLLAIHPRSDIQKLCVNTI
jgi:hypothetical protein